MTTFQGKSVLVLGGSRGIGAAIVRRFANDGANVTFTYAGSRAAADELAAETKTTAVQTDSSSRDAVIARVRESGPLDVLVVNAGIAVFGDALEQDPDAIDRLFRVNVHAGTQEFERRTGHSPKDEGVDGPPPDARDVVIAHPVYGAYGWLAVVDPGPATEGDVRDLLTAAHAAARARHERRAST